MQHVFIVGAKSLGAYGGYETFVYKLTEYHQHNGELKYHVACKANGDGCMDESRLPDARPLGDGVFELHNARCFKIKVPNIGPRWPSIMTSRHWKPAAAISRNTTFPIPSSIFWPAASAPLLRIFKSASTSWAAECS